MNKDARKAIRKMEEAGFRLEQGRNGAALVAPGGRRMKIPSGNTETRSLTIRLRKFAKESGIQVTL